MAEQKTQKEISGVPPQQAATEDTIDLVEVFYLMWGHILQIIACFLVGAVLAFGATYFFITPLYQATASIYIASASNSIVNLSDLQIGSQLTADYRQLMLSRPLLQDVIKKLELELTANQLSSMITITNPSDTRILKITVTNADPVQAADIANELVRQAGIYLPKIMGTEPPSLVEDAVVPSSKSSPSYSRNTMMGALAGAVLYCGVLLVQYLMNDTLVTPDDVSRYLGIQPLAAIPEGDLGARNGNARAKKEKKKLDFLKKYTAWGRDRT
ncbi:MAG: YveK family protein [Faecalibacterium sp.]